MGIRISPGRQGAGAISCALLCASATTWARDTSGDGSEISIVETLPIVLIVLAAMAAFVFGVRKLVLALTAPLTQAAEAFFCAVSARDYDTAGKHLSDEFSVFYDGAALARLTADLGITEVRNYHWINRIRRGRCGYLLGRLDMAPGTTPTGHATLWILLIKRHGAWKLHALRRSHPGLLGYVTPAFRPQEPLP